MVIHALLSNQPAVRPSDSAAKTSAGAGSIKLETCPYVVLTYQPSNKSRASTTGGTTSNRRWVAFRVARAFVYDDDNGFFLPPRALVRISRDTSCEVEVVTLINFPRSKLYRQPILRENSMKSRQFNSPGEACEGDARRAERITTSQAITRLPSHRIWAIFAITCFLILRCYRASNKVKQSADLPNLLPSGL